MLSNIGNKMIVVYLPRVYETPPMCCLRRSSVADTPSLQNLPKRMQMQGEPVILSLAFYII